MRVTRRHILAGAAGAPLLMAGPMLTGGGGARAADTPFVANTYGGRWETFWRSQLLPKLQPALNAPITVDVGLGSSWVASFRTAGPKAPPFSCLMTNERYAVLLREQGFFEPLPVAAIPNLQDVYPVARYPGDVAVTGMISPFGIAYRTDMVKVPPKSWRDLWNPAYRGQIGFYSINNSAAVMLIMLAGKMFGSGEQDIDTGIRKLAELKPFPQVGFSGQLSPLLAQGQVSLAPIDYAEAASLQKKGVPIGMVVPEDGVLMYDQAFNIAAARAGQEQAAKYIDFMLSPEIQLMLAQEFFVAPVNRKVKVPDELKGAIPVSGDDLKNILTFDWSFVAKHNSEISEQWSKAI
ncbi:MAG TPA: ABC transporter substrate-binding protein [Stellaceae bacterium]|nr:ABC transporter substrate-binding protein [Stellaceae bacterium]